MVAQKRVLLAGVTGFLGKVVLSELMRRREELGVDRVFVLVRSTRNRTAESRFAREVANSTCFASLHPEWVDYVSVVSGELTSPNIDLEEGALAELCAQLTHVIHCAATVEFDLSLEEATDTNVTGSLNILELAKRCPRLHSMISCSTCYAVPLPTDGSAIQEKLADLPFSAEAAYRDILAGRADQAALLAQSGLPNTYTLSKCLKEHMMAARQGSVPLVIVRPSIISASLKHPFPGWIDSNAAFAGFVTLIGSGYMHTIIGEPDALLDIVPCDVVATSLIEAAFGPSPDPTKGPQIRQVAAGIDNSCSVSECADIIVSFFRHHPVARNPHIRTIGPYNLRLALTEWWRQRLPNALVRSWCTITGQTRKAELVTKLGDRQNYLNRVFSYFTHNTFRFESSAELGSGFSPQSYLGIVVRGVFQHLLRGDERQITFAGRQHDDGKSDVRWAWRQPNGNLAIRAAAFVIRKVFRRIASRITFDKLSFDRARAQIADTDMIVVIPSHRSYADFLICSYLFFARPDLGVPIPHIAATDDFARIPVLGWLFKHMGAFYVHRGISRENTQLAEQIRHLAASGETLEFFIEGTRSRSRQFLEPKRGLLRALRNNGQRCAILPLAISYDRVPEERTFIKEMTGAPKPRMQLRGLIKWCVELLRGRVDIGRVHLSCGHLQVLEHDTDVPAFSRSIVAQLQSHTVTTSHHLRCFLRCNHGHGLDLDSLKKSIVQRGGRVINSSLKTPEDIHPVVERGMRYHWEHLFYSEALAMFPDNPAIADHITQNGFQDRTDGPDFTDPNVEPLLSVLFYPIVLDYLSVINALGSPTAPLPRDLNARSLVARIDGHLPTFIAALKDLADRGILSTQETGGHGWGQNAADVIAYRDRLLALQKGIINSGLAQTPSTRIE